MKNISKAKFSCRRDGLTVRGYEYRPRGEDLPIAIVSHGFMANLMTVRHYARLLSRMGYAAFCFDFCGGCVVMGRSDGRTTDMSVLTEVDDLCAVIEYAKGLEYTDSSNILLMGCSQGGFVSALTAARLKREVRKLVLFYPALCIPDDARSGKMMWARFDPKKIPNILNCGPMRLGRRYVSDVVDMDAFREIDGYEGDVLIVHGTADGVVAPHYARRAEELYRARAKGSVRLRLIDGGRHMFSGKHDRLATSYLRGFARPRRTKS